MRIAWKSPEHEGTASCFPELSYEENEDILQARAWGYAVFFASMPNAAAQARNTLAGARQYLADHADRIARESQPH